MLIRLVAALLASLLPAATASALTAAPNIATPLLPDLVQEQPGDLVVTRSGQEFRLGFRSAVRNVGAGPLQIAGHRARRAGEMTADQLVAHANGPATLVRDVGAVRFVVSPDHRRWHLLGFQRYALARPGGRALIRERTTGFCLGDRYAVASGTDSRRYTARCGLGRPALLAVTQGISPGFGAAYAAGLDGQYLPLNGLRAGTYELRHRVNATGRLLESRYDNNTASVTIRLRWVRGVPRVTPARR
jgi:Lysyl oxidase